MLRPLNDVRNRLGLRPLSWAFAPHFAAERLLVLTSRAFDYPADLGGNVQYVGPQLEDPEWFPPWRPPWPNGDTRPLVVVGMSTTYQAHERILRNVVDAVADLPVRALVTTGAAIAPPAAPDNVRIASFVPHARVLPQADLVVTHAGHGTTIAALAHGVPLVCLPISRDQPDIAARVAWHRAGVRLRARSTPERIRRALRDVLADDAYRRSAQRLAAAIAAEEPERRGVDALERMAVPRKAPHV
jgi:MGT family glycosyltransferase